MRLVLLDPDIDQQLHALQMQAYKRCLHEDIPIALWLQVWSGTRYIDFGVGRRWPDAKKSLNLSVIGVNAEGRHIPVSCASSSTPQGVCLLIRYAASPFL